MNMTTAIEQVQSLYERHPYPHYPLLAKPRWQDGYLGSSLFAFHLIFHEYCDTTIPKQFLSIGCGEILPYIIRQWEPSATRLTCIDLSARSLRRAEFRTALLGRHTQYHQIDINEYFASPLYLSQKNSIQFDHVEAYGVLHHISSFQTTLNLVREHLAPRGIFRIMVYNSRARDWIWDLNRAFKLLGLEFSSDRDVDDARKLLKVLAAGSPRLKERLKQMGETSLENNARFADTFLHPWESRASIESWFDAFAQAGLKPMALHDRYGELDDLPNPLWSCPSAKQLTERADDLRFENNLELWLTRDDVGQHPASMNSSHSRKTIIPLRLRTKLPPNRFANYRETKDLSLGVKLAIWHGFLKTIYNRDNRASANLIRSLDHHAAARLARMGLILPETADSLGLYEDLQRPIHKFMSPPVLAPSSSGPIALELQQLAERRNLTTAKLNQAKQRLMRVL